MADGLRFDIILNDAKAQATLSRFAKTVDKVAKNTKGFSKSFAMATKSISGMNKELKVSDKLLKSMSKDLQRLAKIAAKLPKVNKDRAKSAAKVAKETAKATSNLKKSSAQSKKVTQNFRNQAAAAAQVSSGLKGGLALLLRYGPAAAAAAAGIAGIAASVRTFKSLVQAGQESQDALVGLRSVAANTGQDIDKATEAAKRFAGEGLITIAEASTSLKNLLAKGFDIDESVELIETLRNSAAFGKQAALDFGDAIAGATEGIKNDNSIKSDNAGITENLSVMVKRYAAELGKSAVNLTQAERRQAILNGFLREGALFAGNFELKLQTFSGIIEVAASKTKLFFAEVGKLITTSPVVIKALQTLLKVVNKLDFKKNEKQLRQFIKTFTIFAVNTLSGVARAISFVIKGLANMARGFRFLIGLGPQIFTFFAEIGLSLQRAIINAQRDLADFINELDFLPDSIRNIGKSLSQAANENNNNLLDTQQILKENMKAFEDTLAPIDNIVNGLDKVSEVTETAANFASDLASELEGIDPNKTVTVDVKSSGKAPPSGGQEAPSPSAEGEGEGAESDTAGLILKTIDAFIGFIKNTSDQEELNKLNDELNETNKILSESQRSVDKYTNSIARNQEKLEELQSEGGDSDQIKKLEESIKKEQELKEAANKEVVKNEAKAKEKAAEVEAKEQLNRNRENARGLATSLSTTIADVLAPGSGAFVGPFVEAASQGAEAVAEQLGGTLDALPDIFIAIAEALPLIIEILIERSPDIALAIVNGIVRLLEVSVKRVVEVLTKALFEVFEKIGPTIRAIFTDPLNIVGEKIEEALSEIGRLLIEPFDNLKNALDGVIKPLEDVASSFSDLFKSFTDLVGKITNIKLPGTGGDGGTTGKILRRIGFATGGIVTGPGNRDSVPATLSPGELVVDRTTGPRLMDYIDRNERMESKPSMDMGNVELLLSQLLQASQAEKTVQSTIELDQEALATILLRMNQDNQRLE